MPKPNSDCRATERKHPWPMVRLGDVCDEIKDRIQSSKIAVGEYVTTDNMVKDCGGIVPAGYVPSEVGLVEYHKGDVLIANIRPYLKKIWLADHDGGCSSDVVVFRSNADGLSSEYLYSVLSQDVYFEYVMQKPRGTKMPRGDRDWMKEFRFPLPPLSEQKEIVARLERELAAVEKMKKGFEELAETAKAEFKAELEETFRHLESKLMLFGDVCEFIRNGASIKQGKGMSGIPITRIETLAGGRINPNRVGYANIYDPHLYDKHILCEGDLLISHINSERYIGRVVMYRGELEGPIIHGMNLLRARLSRLASVLPDYVELYFKTTRARKYILSVIKKAVNQVSVSATDFKCMPLPVPSMELQRQIVDRLSAAKARAEKLEAKAREGVAVCETMRKAILKEAFE